MVGEDCFLEGLTDAPTKFIRLIEEFLDMSQDLANMLLPSTTVLPTLGCQVCPRTFVGFSGQLTMDVKLPHKFSNCGSR